MDKKQKAVLIVSISIILLIVIIALTILISGSNSISSNKITDCLMSSGIADIEKSISKDTFLRDYTFSFKDIENLEVEREDDTITVIFNSNLQNDAYKTTEKVPIEAKLHVQGNTLSFVSARYTGDSEPSILPTVALDPYLLLDNNTVFQVFRIPKDEYDPDINLLPPGASIEFVPLITGYTLSFSLYDLKDAIKDISLIDDFDQSKKSNYGRFGRYIKLKITLDNGCRLSGSFYVYYNVREITQGITPTWSIREGSGWSASWKEESL